MELAAYLEKTGITDADFAMTIGVSRSMVTKIRNRQAKPSADTALRIQRATKGRVMLSDLIVDGASDSK